HFRPSQVAGPRLPADTFTGRPTREVEVTGQWLLWRGVSFIGNEFAATASPALRLRAVALNVSGIDVSRHGHTPYASKCGPKSSMAVSDVPSWRSRCRSLRPESRRKSHRATL